MTSGLRMSKVLGHGSSTHRGAARDVGRRVKNPNRVIGLGRFMKLSRRSATSYDVRGVDDGTNKSLGLDHADAMYNFSPKKRGSRAKKVQSAGPRLAEHHISISARRKPSTASGRVRRAPKRYA